jgi:hypothetical protein
MDYEELIDAWADSFIELGYKEASFNNWILQTGEIISVLSLRVDTKKRDFNIDMGIIFKKLYEGRSWKNIKIEHAHIIQGVYNILKKMGESKEYLDELLSYDPTDYSEVELKNISAIMELFKNKVIPHFKKLNDYALTENFLEKKSWQPFLEYFIPNDYYKMFLNGKLNKPSKQLNLN